MLKINIFWFSFEKPLHMCYPFLWNGLFRAFLWRSVLKMRHITCLKCPSVIIYINDTLIRGKDIATIKDLKRLLSWEILDEGTQSILTHTPHEDRAREIKEDIEAIQSRVYKESVKELSDRHLKANTNSASDLDPTIEWGVPLKVRKCKTYSTPWQ